MATYKKPLPPGTAMQDSVLSDADLDKLKNIRLDEDSLNAGVSAAKEALSRTSPTMSKQDVEFRQKLLERFDKPGFIEGATTGVLGRERGGIGVAAPLLSTGADAEYVYRATRAAQRSERGTATAEDLELLEDIEQFLYRSQGAGAGYIAGATVGEATAFVPEFFIGGAVWKAAAKMGMTAAGKKALQRFLKGRGTERVSKIAAEWAAKAPQTAQTIARSVASSMGVGARQYFGQNVAGHMVNGALGVIGADSVSAGRTRAYAMRDWFINEVGLDQDTAYNVVAGIDEDAGTWLKYLPKAILDDYIEMWSEASGEMLGKAVLGIVPGLKAQIIRKGVHKYGKEHVRKKLATVGLASFGEEMLEEAFGATMRETAGQVLPDVGGIGDLQGSLEEFWEPENLLGMMVGMGIVSGASRGIATVTSSGRKASATLLRSVAGRISQGIREATGMQSRVELPKPTAEAIRRSAVAQAEQNGEENPEAAGEAAVQETIKTLQEADTPELAQRAVDDISGRLRDTDVAGDEGWSEARDKGVQALQESLGNTYLDASVVSGTLAGRPVYRDPDADPLAGRAGFWLPDAADEMGGDVREIPVSEYTPEEQEIADTARRLGVALVWVDGEGHSVPAAHMDYRYQETSGEGVLGGMTDGTLIVMSRPMMSDMSVQSMAEVGFRDKDGRPIQGAGGLTPEQMAKLEEPERVELARRRRWEHLFHELVHEMARRSPQTLKALDKFIQETMPVLYAQAKKAYNESVRKSHPDKQIKENEETIAVVSQVLWPFLHHMHVENNMHVFNELVAQKDSVLERVADMFARAASVLPWVNIDTMGLRRVRAAAANELGSEAYAWSSDQVAAAMEAARLLYGVFSAPPVKPSYEIEEAAGAEDAAEHPDSAARAAVDEGLELGEDLQAQADALVTGDAEAADDTEADEAEEEAEDALTELADIDAQIMAALGEGRTDDAERLEKERAELVKSAKVSAGPAEKKRAAKKKAAKKKAAKKKAGKKKAATKEAVEEVKEEAVEQGQAKKKASKKKASKKKASKKKAAKKTTSKKAASRKTSRKTKGGTPDGAKEWRKVQRARAAEELGLEPMEVTDEERQLAAMYDVALAKGDVAPPAAAEGFQKQGELADGTAYGRYDNTKEGVVYVDNSTVPAKSVEEAEQALEDAGGAVEARVQTRAASSRKKKDTAAAEEPKKQAKTQAKKKRQRKKASKKTPYRDVQKRLKAFKEAGQYDGPLNGKYDVMAAALEQLERGEQPTFGMTPGSAVEPKFESGDARKAVEAREREAEARQRLKDLHKRGQVGEQQRQDEAMVEAGVMKGSRAVSTKMLERIAEMDRSELQDLAITENRRQGGLPLVDPRNETERLRKDLIDLLNRNKKKGPRLDNLVDRQFVDSYVPPEGSLYDARDNPAEAVLADLTGGNEDQVMASHGIDDADVQALPEKLGAMQRVGRGEDQKWVPWPTRRARILYEILRRQGLDEGSLLGIGQRSISPEEIVIGEQGTPVVDNVSYGDGGAVNGEATLAGHMPTVMPDEGGAVLVRAADPSVHDNMGGTLAWWQVEGGPKGAITLTTNNDGSADVAPAEPGAAAELEASLDQARKQLESQRLLLDQLREALESGVDPEGNPLSPEAREAAEQMLSADAPELERRLAEVDAAYRHGMEEHADAAGAANEAYVLLPKPGTVFELTLPSYDPDSAQAAFVMTDSKQHMFVDPDLGSPSVIIVTVEGSEELSAPRTKVAHVLDPSIIVPASEIAGDAQRPSNEVNFAVTYPANTQSQRELNESVQDMNIARAGQGLRPLYPSDKRFGRSAFALLVPRQQALENLELWGNEEGYQMLRASELADDYALSDEEKAGPLWVYHSTTSPWTLGDLSKVGNENDYGWLGLGFYFADSLNHSAWYIGAHTVEGVQAPGMRGGVMMPLHLRSIRTLRLSGGHTFPDFAKAVTEALGIVPPGGPNVFMRADKNWGVYARHELERRGFDAVKYTFETGPWRGTSEYMVMYPHQMTSATGNIGTYGQERPTKAQVAQLEYDPAWTGEHGRGTMTVGEAIELQEKGDIRFAVTGRGVATSGPSTALLMPGSDPRQGIVLLNKYLADLDDYLFKRDSASKRHFETLQAAMPSGLSPREQDDWLQRHDAAMLLYIDTENTARMRDEEGNLVYPSRRAIFDKYSGDLSPAQREAWELSQQLPQKVKALADQIIRENDAMGTIALANNVITNKHEVYAARLWFRKGQGAAGGLVDPTKPGGPLRTRPAGRQKRRVYDSILQGLALGETLRVPGALEAQRIATRQVGEAIYNQALIKALSDQGIIVQMADGKPVLAKDAANRLAEQARERGLDPEITLGEAAKNLKQMQEAGFAPLKAVQFQGYFAPKQLAKQINAITETIDYDNQNAFWNYVTGFNAWAKSTILTFSFFHHQAFMRSSIVTMDNPNLMTNLAHIPSMGVAALKTAGYAFGLISRESIEASARNMPAYNAGRQAILDQAPELIELVRAGLTVGSVQDLEPALHNDLADFRKKLDGALKKLNISPKAMGAYDKFVTTQRRASHWLFNNMGAHLKVQGAMIEFAHLRRKYAKEVAMPWDASNPLWVEGNPDTSARAHLARLAAEKLNADFGGLNLRRMTGKATKGARGVGTQRWLRLLLLAPDWTESNLITAIKAIKGGGKAEKQVYRDMWLNVAVRFTLPTLVWNFMMAGFDWDEWWEDTKRASAAGGESPWDGLHKMYYLQMNINPLAEMFNKHLGERGAQTGSDKYFSLMGHFGDPLKWSVSAMTGGKGLMSVPKGKMGPISTSAYNLFQGEDWAGRQYTDVRDMLGVSMFGREADPEQLGKFVSWAPSGKGAITPMNLPSYVGERMRSVLPIQAEAAIRFSQGEIDAIDALSRLVGMAVHRTYPPQE